jgi:hypothetical protein
MCVQMQDGFAMWIFAAIWFLIAMPIMRVSVCIDRRDLRRVAVEVWEDDEDPDPELSRFTIGSLT